MYVRTRIDAPQPACSCTLFNFDCVGLLKIKGTFLTCLSLCWASLLQPGNCNVVNHSVCKDTALTCAQWMINFITIRTSLLLLSFNGECYLLVSIKLTGVLSTVWYADITCWVSVNRKVCNNPVLQLASSYSPFITRFTDGNLLHL